MFGKETHYFERQYIIIYIAGYRYLLKIIPMKMASIYFLYLQQNQTDRF